MQVTLLVWLCCLQCWTDSEIQSSKSGWSNRLLCLKADQKNVAQWFVIFTEWILQLWEVNTLQSCLLVRTCVHSPQTVVCMELCACLWKAWIAYMCVSVCACLCIQCVCVYSQCVCVYVLTVCLCWGSAGCGRLSEGHSDASYELRPYTPAAVASELTQWGWRHTDTHSVGEGRGWHQQLWLVSVTEEGGLNRAARQDWLIWWDLTETVYISSVSVWVCTDLFYFVNL